MLAIFACCAIILLLVVYYTKCYRKLPPGPYGLPVVGYYPFLGVDPIETIHDLSKKHGNIMSINLLGETFWVLNSYEAIVEAFVTKGDIFAARHSNEYGLFQISAKDTVLIYEGDEWKVHTKFIVGHLAQLGMGKSHFEVTIRSILEDVEKCIDSKDGNAHNYSQLLHNYTFNVLTEMMCGKRFEMEDPIIGKMMHWNETIFSCLQYMNMLLSGNVFRLLLAVKSHYTKTMKSNLYEFNEFASGLVEERRKTFDGNHCLYYVDYWLKESNGPNGQYFKIDKLAKEFSQMYQSSSVPAAVLYHSLYLIALHPNIQQRVFEEIDNTIGTERDFSCLEMDRLPYTTAVINEILRFVSFSPLGVVHVNTAPTQLMGFAVPERQKIIANFYALTRDPKHFVNPNEFDPNNFLDENGCFKPNCASMPFGIGYRKCLGSKLAEALIYLAFVRFIQKFEWTLYSNDFDSLVYTQGDIRFIKPYKVCAKRRQ